MTETSAETALPEFGEGNPHEFMTPHEIAKYIKVSKAEVYMLMRQVPPPWPYYFVTPVKKHSKRADIDKWLEQRRISGAGEAGATQARRK